MTPRRDPRRPSANLDAAFSGTHAGSHEGVDYRVAVVPIGELCLPSGWIVAGDPSALEERVDQPFQQTVAPGTYPVDLAVLQQRRREPSGRAGSAWHAVSSAAMRIRFRDAPVAEWLIATTRDDNVAKLAPFEICGYGVDTGLGAFVDAATLEVAARERWLDVVWDEVVMPAFDPEVPIPASYTAAFSFDASGDPTLVVCRSGQGDGFYASYWGLGSEGVPVCLVTDFGVLVHHEERLEAVGAIADLRGREHRVELPGGTLIVQLAQPDPRVVQVDLTGPAAGSVEPMLELDEETIPVAGTSHSGARYELTFDDPVPERATFTVQYLDRLVPL